MTMTEMRALAREIGILSLHIKELEDRKKAMKKTLEQMMSKLPLTESKGGTLQHILEGVTGFTAKMYGKTQFYANQAKARELLHPNTWAAIFKPTSFNVVDVRPTAETKRMGVNALIRELDLAS
jgi:hypothetical protein